MYKNLQKKYTVHLKANPSFKNPIQKSKSPQPNQAQKVLIPNNIQISSIYFNDLIIMQEIVDKISINSHFD